MTKPLFSYKPGTNIGMCQVLNGAFIEKTVMLKITDKTTGEERWIRVKQHVYGKVLWVWTGYRWVPADGRENTEIYRDGRRWAMGMRLDENGEWTKPCQS